MKLAVIINENPYLLVKSKRGFSVQNLKTQKWMSIIVNNKFELAQYLTRVYV